MRNTPLPIGLWMNFSSIFRAISECSGVCGSKKCAITVYDPGTQRVDVLLHDLRAVVADVVVQRAVLDQRDRLAEVEELLHLARSSTSSGSKMSALTNSVLSFSSSSARPCASTTGSLSM